MTWYRVMCDRHDPLTPVCDIERTDASIEVYPQFVVRVPELVDATDLETRVRASIEALRTGKPAPRYHDGLVRTSNPDVARNGAFWITCEMCRRVKGINLSARANSGILSSVLNGFSELETIADVEVMDAVPRDEWEADPSQPRHVSHRVTMYLLPLHALCEALRRNPRGASTK